VTYACHLKDGRFKICLEVEPIRYSMKNKNNEQISSGFLFWPKKFEVFLF
jgi:hypothetical protein